MKDVFDELPDFFDLNHDGAVSWDEKLMGMAAADAFFTKDENEEDEE